MPLSSFPTPAPRSAPTQEVDAAEIQVQVCLYAFDLIYLNGEVSSGCMSGGSRGEVGAVYELRSRPSEWPHWAVILRDPGGSPGHSRGSL